MNEIYIKVLAARARQDETLLEKLPEEVRVQVETKISESLNSSEALEP